MCPYKEQQLISSDDSEVEVNIYEAETEAEMEDSDESDGTDSDMSDDHEEADDQGDDTDVVSPDESDDPQAVELPPELSELAAGREDNVDDDDVVQAILRAREKHSNHPPDIAFEDAITGISFHPSQDVIAASTYTGDVLLYKYSDESTELKSTMELHLKAIRGVEFSEDGQHIVSCSKDKSIMVSNAETGKLVRVYENAHQDPLYSLYVIDENLFASGCDSGYVKLWDMRREQPIFSLRAMDDEVNAMITTEMKRHLVVACGGTLTSINLHTRKIQVQSEEYEHDLTCLGLFRQETKLLVGSSKGTMYLFNWGEFGFHSDEFTELKQNISCLLPVTESVAVLGCEDGNIRATHLFPHKHLGIVGQHKFSVECLDISHDGTIIASAAGDGSVIKFWNIKYFEETEVACKKSNKRKELKNNLPSSGFRNAGEFFSDLAGSS